MALRKCKECGGQVAKSAPACPHCGAKQPKQTSRATWLVLIAIVLVTANAMFSDPAPTTRAAEPELTEEQKAAKAEQSRKDAQRYVVIERGKKAVLARLKDPDSAQFGQVTYREPGIACGFVNARNSFGGYTGEKRFLSLGSSETTVLEDDEGFAGLWNSKCAS